MYIYIYMASVNISLKEEAYEKLASLKRPDESFSDEILRLTERGTGSDLLEKLKQVTPISPKLEKEFLEGVKKSRISMKKILYKWGQVKSRSL